RGRVAAMRRPIVRPNPAPGPGTGKRARGPAQACAATSCEDPQAYEYGHDQQGIARGNDVVPHDPEAALDLGVEILDGRRLGDIEQPEQAKRGQLRGKGAGHQPQHQPERHHLVPYDTDMVVYLQFTRDRKSTRLNSSHVKTSYAAF